MRWIKCCGLAVFGFVLGPAAASGQGSTFELKLSDWLPASHPLQQSLEEWGASVERDSAGTITYKVYLAAQLGKAFDHYAMAPDGVADFALVSPGFQRGRFPIFDAVNLPFMMSNARAGSAALDDWYRKYAATEMAKVKYCFAFAQDPGTFHSRTKQIVVPSDLAGMKIRSADATMASFVRQLGGDDVPAATLLPEALQQGMEQGIADAVTLPWGSAVLFGVDKVAKYHMQAAVYTAGFVWVMNKDTYAAMSPAQQKVIDAHCNSEWAEKIAAPWADFEHDGIARLQAEPDQEIYPLTEAQHDEWKMAAAPLVQSWSLAVKGAVSDADAVFKALKAELAKLNSGE
jgi:TRAP-type C4-dicarboxylate transport system substrate-binding protein